MKYRTSYWWQERPGISLSLQQVLRRRDRQPMLFACICAGRDCDRAGRELTDWFYGKGIALGGREGMGAAQRQIEGLWREGPGSCMGGGGGYPLEGMVGIFCTGDAFLLFSQGEQRAYLLNTRFRRAHCRRLTARTGGLCCMWGILQPQIGILLATEGFYTPFSEAVLRDCLCIRRKEQEETLERHLRELAGEGERHGGRNMAAVCMTVV